MDTETAALAEALEALDLGSIDEESRLEQWRGLTMPQRMLTMALFWNCMSDPSRLASVHKLVELLRGGGIDQQLAGAIIFLLLGMWAATGLVGTFFDAVLGAGWAIFYILIVLLQAFIFMMLTIVYMAMAHESH